jgi:hypothetical protein
LSEKHDLFLHDVKDGVSANVKVGFVSEPFASVIKSALLDSDELGISAGVQGSRDFKLVG